MMEDFIFLSFLAICVLLVIIGVPFIIWNRLRWSGVPLDRLIQLHQRDPTERYTEWSRPIDELRHRLQYQDTEITGDRLFELASLDWGEEMIPELRKRIDATLKALPDGELLRIAEMPGMGIAVDDEIRRRDDETHGDDLFPFYPDCSGSDSVDLDCDCGCILHVSVGAAGTTTKCGCGIVHTIPSLSELRRRQREQERERFESRERVWRSEVLRENSADFRDAVVFLREQLAALDGNFRRRQKRMAIIVVITFALVFSGVFLSLVFVGQTRVYSLLVSGFWSVASTVFVSWRQDLWNRRQIKRDVRRAVSQINSRFKYGSAQRRITLALLCDYNVRHKKLCHGCYSKLDTWVAGEVAEEFRTEWDALSDQLP